MTTAEVRIAGRPFTVSTAAEPSRRHWLSDAAERFEPETEAFLAAALAPGDRLLDIGAWLGPISLAAVAMGAAGVVALEPDPVAFAELERNLALDEIDAVARRAAVDAAPGELTLHGFKGLGSSNTSALRRAADAAPADSFTVPAITLPEALALVPGAGPVVTKIDVEGHEYALAEAIAAHLREPRVKALHLALHPGILWRAARAEGRGLAARRDLAHRSAALVAALAESGTPSLTPSEIRRRILFSWKVPNLNLSVIKP